MDPQDFPIQYRAVCRGACGVMKLGVVLVVSTTDEKISLWAEGKGSGFVDTILVAERAGILMMTCSVASLSIPSS